MKTISSRYLLAALASALGFVPGSASASIAYGSINNFDTVNDTGHECHGFEIELEDCRSTDISYTYDYNHYGTPKITQDDSVAGHPRCIIRWASKRNPDGTWAAYTAIPAGPIAPTDGHRFTNPSINFGGEHFGVGYSVAVPVIRYHWLIDDGTGTLVHGGAVNVSTPAFIYYPPAAGAVAQVQAVIEPPEPPEVEPQEFGKASWVKEIRTTSHNNQEMKLRDLVSDDPDRQDEKNWKNGEPDEVETEWEILQKDYGKADGGPNAKKPAAPEDVPDGDEVVTRRYEFFEYVGPVDAESGEAMADAVGPDGIHGEGIKTINGVDVDLSTVVVVGEFSGSQMAALQVDAPVGLVDHVSEGEVGVAFAGRSLVVPGAWPFLAMLEGPLPEGMVFDEVTGVLSGTPTVSGEFIFKVTALDDVNPTIEKNYTLRIAAAGEALLAASVVDTAADPAGSGTTSGDGSYAPGETVQLSASAEAGFRFRHWTDNGKVVGNTEAYEFVADINHSLKAHFTPDVPQWTVTTSSVPEAGGSTTGAGAVDEGSNLTLTAVPAAGYQFSYWSVGGVSVSTASSYTFVVTADRAVVAHFTALTTYTVSTAAAPVAGGTVTGGGSFVANTSVTLTASANPGFVFTRWTSGGNTVSNSATYTFPVSFNRSLTANFIAAGTQQTIALNKSPVAGGSVSGAGNFLTGDAVSVTAEAAPGYKFVRWQEGSTNVSTSAAYTFTCTGSRTLTAKFNEAFVVTTVASPAVGGLVEADSAEYKSGEKAKVRAFPEDGYTFVNWTEDGVQVSTSSSYTFDVSANRTLTAHFLAITGYTISAGCHPPDAGEVSGEGRYDDGDDVMLEAVARPGFRFNGWTRNGVAVSQEAAFSFPADSNAVLAAQFIALVEISGPVDPPAGGVVEGYGAFMAGESVTLTAQPEAGFAFVRWMEGAEVVSQSNPYTLTVAAARMVTPYFVPMPELKMTRGTGADWSLAWPETPEGWVLEQSSDLTNWAPVEAPVTTGAGENSTTLTPVGQASFFRLTLP